VRAPIEDTRWGAVYGSVAEVQAAFDRFGPQYHEAILESGVPRGAAEALRPYLTAEAQGIDLGCGSGVLGLALREAGLPRALDGLDLSPGMLELARQTGCYRELARANLLLPGEGPRLAAPYDFAVSVGLVGDYVPYYVALPYFVSLLKAGACLGFAVEQVSTPSFALAACVAELGLRVLLQTELGVPAEKLEGQTYQFFVARWEGGTVSP
jgi:predicted TPR repeat methyltransferase